MFSDKIGVMRAYSPAQAPKMVLSLGFLLLIRWAAHGEVLLLPDLVIVRDAEPDIPLPNLFPDLAENWNPTPPRYRRQYRIPIEVKPPKSSPEDLPFIDPTADIGELSPESLGALSSTELGSPQPGEWSAGAASDIREGADVDVSRTFENLGEIEATIFIPFSERTTGPRPWSGQIGWDRDGLLSSAVKIGAKEEDGVLPYLAAALNWDRGINQPDKYSFELYHYGFSPYRLSILGGMDLSFRIKGSNWSIITKIEGGVSHAVSDTDGSARGVLAIGLKLFNHGLLGEVGIDIAYDDSDKIRAMPFLGFSCLVDDNISVYADAEIFMRYPDNLGRIFRGERLSGFEARTPIHSKYRFGIAQIGSKRVSSLFEISYAEGSFCKMEEGIVISGDDRRARGLVSLAYDFGDRRISFSSELDFSLLGFTDIWEGKVELMDGKLSYYLFGGSQDAILGEFFDGSRGGEAIIGLGLDWKISENWRAGASAYAKMPWESPSLELTVAWKSTGAVN